MDEDHKDPGWKKVMALYIACIVALVFQFLPQPSLQAASVIMLMAIVAVIKFLRRSAEKDSLMHNHATYLSRTISIWSLFLLISLTAAGLYIRRLYDFEQLLDIIQSFSSGKIETPEAKHLAMIGAASMIPSTLYLFYRAAKGFHRAVKGYRLAKPKGIF
ncbi:MAG TPA: hypothetical protein VIF12_07820 [Micavibrio sp.]|jgi:uncharacterized membrane protein